MKRKIAKETKLLLVAITLTAAGVLADKVVNAENITPFVRLDDCIPLDDVAEYYIGNDGYYYISLKDVTHQLDDPENLTYDEILKDIPDVTDTGCYWNR